MLYVLHSTAYLGRKKNKLTLLSETDSIKLCSAPIIHLLYGTAALAVGFTRRGMAFRVLCVGIFALSSIFEATFVINAEKQDVSSACRIHRVTSVEERNHEPRTTNGHSQLFFSRASVPPRA